MISQKYSEEEQNNLNEIEELLNGCQVTILLQCSINYTLVIDAFWKQEWMK
jgi:hypothetical protein